MSANFDRFITQYNATGRGAQEGYDANHFDRLEPNERDSVRQMLSQKLTNGDIPSVHGLSLLDGHSAVGMLQSAASSAQSASGFKAALLGEMAAITGETKYVTELSSELRVCNGNIRNDIFALTTRIPLTHALFNLLKEWLIVEPKAENILYLAEVILSKAGISRWNSQTEAKFYFSRSLLISNYLKVKNDELAEIENSLSFTA